MRYGGVYNFIGRRARGYENAKECVLTEAAALALAQVQQAAMIIGYSLVVWDCYRPDRAAKQFYDWAMDANDGKMKVEFFPNISKSEIASNYISYPSSHSQGIAVDVGLVRSGVRDVPKKNLDDPLVPCTASEGQRFADGTIDFGTGFDCFDEQSGETSKEISNVARENRKLLQSLMANRQFKLIPKEWWHFELDDLRANRIFDFPIPARP